MAKFKFNFLKRFKFFNKKKSKGNKKQTSNTNTSTNHEANTSTTAMVPGVEAVPSIITNPPSYEEKTSINLSQHQLLDDLCRVSRSCSYIRVGGNAQTFERSSTLSDIPHHGPIDVDTCQLQLLKNKNSQSNESMNDDGAILTTGPAMQDVLNHRSSISLRTTSATSAQLSVEEATVHELELLSPRPYIGGSVDSIQEIRTSDSNNVITKSNERASTPEKGDLLSKHQDECNSSPTSVLMFDSTYIVERDNDQGIDESSKETTSEHNKSTTSSSSYQASIASLISPPQIIRHMPTAIFGNATNTLSSMWTIEDTTATSSTTTAAAAKEFLALKKDAEKNEFKKVVLHNSKVAGVQDGSMKRKRSGGVGEPHEMIEIQMNQDEKKDSSCLIATDDDAVSSHPSDIPPQPSASAEEDMNSSLVPPHSPSDVIVDIIQPPLGSQQFLDDMQADDDGTYSESDSCSYDSEFDTIGEITICSETKRLLEANRLYENDIKTNVDHPARNRRSILKVKKSPVKEICFGANNNTATNMSRSLSGRMESIKTEMNVPVDDDTDSLPSIQTQQKKVNITWYDDEANWNKPFTLRSDESFDISTVTSSRMSSTPNGSRIKKYNVVDQLLGDFIKGIGKYACFDEENAASFDAAEQQEI